MSGPRSTGDPGRPPGADFVAAFDDAVRTRRTHKAYGAEPISRATLLELFELARWAPNHHLTEPWRFRVVGPHALEALKSCAPPGEGSKLDRAPTLVVASARLTGDLATDEEDLCATAAAIYVILLGAHARGLAAYWRTPALLRGAPGRAAVAIPDGERVLGLLYLGHPRQTQPPPERSPVEAFAQFLD